MNYGGSKVTVNLSLFQNATRSVALHSIIAQMNQCIGSENEFFSEFEDPTALRKLKATKISNKI